MTDELKDLPAEVVGALLKAKMNGDFVQRYRKSRGYRKASYADFAPQA